MLTTKQIYDLNNRNALSQDVQLGTLLNAIDTNGEKPVEELTERQIYNLNNDNVVFQELQFGSMLNSILIGEHVNDLEEDEQDRLCAIDKACQDCQFGIYLQNIIAKTPIQSVQSKQNKIIEEANQDEEEIEKASK